MAGLYQGQGMSDSIFTKIINREISSKIIYEDDLCIAINDTHPQAPIHILVIPKKPLVNLAEAEESDKDLLGHLMLVISKLAHQQGIADGFRVVANNGRGGGQTVFHLHFHLMGRKSFSEQGM